MEYRILGPLEVRDGDHIVDIPGVKEKALLALLLVELGTVVSIDRIIFELWGDDAPPSALGTVRTLVSRLRRHLGKETVLSQRPGYRIEAEPEQVDSHLFEELADRLSRHKGDMRATVSTAARAFGLWRGDALAEFQGYHFADNEARRLEHRKLVVQEILFDIGLRSGRHLDLIPQLREAIAHNPLHEPLYGKLMIALYRSGRGAEALAVYSDLARLLGEELGIEPSHEIRDIERAIVMEDDSLDLDSPDTPHNLPTSLTSFVGRTSELEALVDAIPSRRLVTLTGPGGSGKSRLALEVANRLLASFPDGVWRVELAPLRDAESVVPAIAAVFGDPASHSADPIGSLTDFLGRRQVLLLLDNCEHLVDAVSQNTATILQRCPDVTIVTTSRRPLGMPGESVWLVPPLRLPDPETSVAEQRASEAAQLFLSRAGDAVSDFELAGDDEQHVLEICRLVDGLPLALELAAARVASMSLRTLTDRLRSDLEVLSGPRGSAAARHQTMTAALDWSYRLLDQESAEILCRLAVFRGGWTSEDVRSILGEESIDIVAELVDNSLVERLQGRRLEYRLLEPIREYVHERFKELPDVEEVAARHAETFLDLARRSDEALRSTSQMQWLGLMDEEHDNLRRALAHSLDANSTATALKLVASLGTFWFMGGHWKESWEWLNKAIEHAGDDHPAEMAVAVYRTGAIQVIRVNHEAVMPWVQDALAICEANGDRYGQAWCLHLIGHAMTFGAPQEALGQLTQARDIFAELGSEWEVAWSDRFIGSSLYDVGERAEGLDLMLRSVSDFRELGDLWETAYGLYGVGANLLAYDDPISARPYLLRCLRLSEEMGDRVWSAHAISRLGLVALKLGEDDAESLFRDAVERHRLIGDDICLAAVYGYLGDITEESQGDGEAVEFQAQSIRVAQRINATRLIAAAFDRIARSAIKHGRREEAGRLVGAVQSAMDRGVLAPHPAYDPIHVEAMELVGTPAIRGETIESLIPFALETAESLREATIS